jgi:ribosomal protein S18 acetylase RimI-like enzyme
MTNNIKFREAADSDIQAIANLFSSGGNSEKYWYARIQGYKNCEFTPHQALSHRLLMVATSSDSIIGFIAGHLTTRLDYTGQIQWLTVTSEYRRKGVGSELLSILSGWFVENNSLGISVDIDPDNAAIQSFYKSRHAESLNKYWLYWRDIRVVLLKEKQGNIGRWPKF